ncbi:extracellular solute-binding protein [Paenibacillus alkalitolerans]|uniref:extracellular solute-binding protein n=1 Tax=Paenibacillus alkalitolerans TaxID=2799335 RepID=UPI0018F38E70|nr:extracellular solute-binding protein [Paenibacillus alkalitolerans]
MKLKVLAILTLAVTVVLSGCAGNNAGSGSSAEQKEESAANSNTSNTANQETEEKPLEQADVTWFTSIGFWPAPQWDTTPGTVMGNITEKTGVKFTFDVPPQDGDTKLNLLLVSSGNDFPDVITTVDQGMATKLASSGKVWDLDEFLKEYYPESHLLKDFPADIKEQIVDRFGGWYYFPSHMASDNLREMYPPSDPYFADNTQYSKNQGVMVNKDLLEQAGLTLDDLKTESGFLNALQKVKDMKLTVDGQPVVPLQIDGKDYQRGGALMTLQQMFGATEIDKDGNYRNILLAPGTKNAIQFLNKAYRGGYLDAGQLTMDNNAVKAQYASGRVFAFVGNMANVKYDPKYVSPGAIMSDDGAKPVFTYNSLPGAGWMKTFISKSTKHPEQLARFVDYITSPEGYINAFFGIKDVHYTVDDQGLITETDKAKEDRDAKNIVKTGLGVFWQFSNLSFENHVKKAAPTEEGLVRDSTFQAFGKTPGIERFDVAPLTLPSEFYAPGSENVKIRDQINQAAEIQISKMVLAKDQASFDKYYDEYVDQLKKLNVDKLDAALNEELHKQEQKLGVKVKVINP